MRDAAALWRGSNSGAGCPRLERCKTNFASGGHGAVEFPGWSVVARRAGFGEGGATHFDGHIAVEIERVVEGAIGHFAIEDEFFVQGVKLQSAEHVGALIDGFVGAFEGAADFAFGVGAFVPDAIDQEVHALLRGPLAEMEV